MGGGFGCVRGIPEHAVDVGCEHSRNVGPPLSGDGIHVPLPLTLRVGGAYRFLSKTRKGRSDGFMVSTQLDAPDDDLAVGRVGVEYSQSVLSVWRVAARAGWASRGVGSDSSLWSLGGGVEAGFFRINFAQLIQGNLGNETRVDVAVRFGREL